MRAGWTGRAPDLLAAALLALFVIPLVALVVTGSPGELVTQMRQPAIVTALVLTLETTLVSIAIVVVAGTPLAWRLARATGAWARWVSAIVELPIVIPPAVVGIALLLAFGRNGMLAPLGVSLPFTTAAVVLAQIVVAAPFFVQSATAAFRGVDDDLLLVARTLGASRARAFLRVALPTAAPGLAAGLGLAWARAMGEFGATLLFAGNMPGRTQTMPLAIYAALERDVAAARALAIVLAGVALVVLAIMRAVPRRLGLDPSGEAREP